jgi:hypothetical protein
MFFPECAISHVFPPEFAVSYIYFPECVPNHVFPPNLLPNMFSQNVLPIMFFPQ